jgi:hypothetical protein
VTVLVVVVTVLATAITGPAAVAGQAVPDDSEPPSFVELMTGWSATGGPAVPQGTPSYLLTGEPVDDVLYPRYVGQYEVPVEADLGDLDEISEVYLSAGLDEFPRLTGGAFYTYLELDRPIEDCGPGEIREVDLYLTVPGEPVVDNPDLPNYPLDGASRVVGLFCIDGTTEMTVFDADAGGGLVPNPTAAVEVYSWPAADGPAELPVADDTPEEAQRYLVVTDPSVTEMTPWSAWLVSGGDNMVDPTSYWAGTHTNLGDETVVLDPAAAPDETDETDDTDEADGDGAAPGAEGPPTEGAADGAADGDSTTATEASNDDDFTDSILFWAMLVIVIPAFLYGGYRFWNRQQLSIVAPPDPDVVPEGDAMLSDGASDRPFPS